MARWPPTRCPTTGSQALRHEPRTKVQRPAHVGATPVADHRSTLGKVPNLFQDLTTRECRGVNVPGLVLDQLPCILNMLGFSMSLADTEAQSVAAGESGVREV